MRTNWRTVVWCDRLVLVPYRRCHVLRYHGWMQCTQLRQLTGSEQLSLSQELAMQRSWRRDPRKCTFILLDRNSLQLFRRPEEDLVSTEEASVSTKEGVTLIKGNVTSAIEGIVSLDLDVTSTKEGVELTGGSPPSRGHGVISSKESADYADSGVTLTKKYVESVTGSAVSADGATAAAADSDSETDADDCSDFIESEAALAAMIGDVNLFLHPADDDDDAEGRTDLAEIEVMLAEPWSRGGGRGRCAVASILRYAVEALQLRRFQVKIGLQNAASRRLFESLDFREVSRSEVFQEVTCEATADTQWMAMVCRECPGYSVQSLAASSHTGDV